MSTMRLFVAGFFTFILFNSTVAYSGAGHENSAMQQMAEIMHRLKHYPSPDGMASLKEITQSSTASKNERMLAGAMMNLQHKAAAADMPKLKAMMADKNATAHEREMARVIMELDHRPTKQHKMQLEMMMK